MTHPSFLARKTFGLSNYFLIALGFAVFAALLPRAAREALHSNTNRAEDWLPHTYVESSDLKWFRQHFISEGFVLVTWDGCTLGNAEKLNLLAQKLSARLQPVEPETVEALKARHLHTGKWFRKIISGPSMIRELTEPPLNLTYVEAVRRLEGVLVGPPTKDAEGNPLGDETRATCLVTYMAPEGYETNRAMRRVVDEITHVAVDECGVPMAQLHMGGPTVDNVSIDRAGEGSFTRLAALSGVVGLVITYWCFRDLMLTGVVFAVGAVSAAMSLALIFYYGVAEVFIGGLPTPKYGRMDAVLMSMPPLVYVLGLSGAIHLVNYYRDTRVLHGLQGAAERACRMAWTPCFLAAFTTTLGLGSLIVSDIIPIKKFGGYSGVAVTGTLAVLFSLLPVYLHRFPPRRFGGREWKDIAKDEPGLPPWGAAFARWLTNHHRFVTSACILAMIVVGYGVTRLQSSIQLLKLLDEESDLIKDYAWAEEHLGNLVPMEVVITVPPECRRSADEHAEEGGRHYRMTMLERLGMLRRVLTRVEELDEVSRAMSVATYAPEGSQNVSAAIRRGNDYTLNKSLEDNRDAFRDFLQLERDSDGTIEPNGRELWRITARITALRDIDYGQFDDELRKEVEPVLVSYRQRDELVRALYESDRKLEGARLCILFHGNAEEKTPSDDTPEGMLADLLRESGVKDRVEGRAGSLAFYNLAQLENPAMTPEERAAVIEALRDQDAVLLASKHAEATAQSLRSTSIALVDVVEPTVPPGSAAVAADPGAGPRTVRAMYTGIIPLVFKTQRQLLVSLRQSIESATILICFLMAVLLRSPTAGIVAMLPNVFPIFVVFGALGWLGIKIDIGIMMTASVALGIAVDNTLHLLTWVRDGIRRGLDRRAAVLAAYDRCAVAMVESALVGGLGLVVFGASSFTPTQQFGYMMITILVAALVGDTIMLPALIVSPLGKCFEPRSARGGGRSSGGSPSLHPGNSCSTGEDRVPECSTSSAATLAEPAPVVPERVPHPADNRGPPPPLDRRTAELTSPQNAALLAKLRSFRRPSPHDPRGTR